MLKVNLESAVFATIRLNLGTKLDESNFALVTGTVYIVAGGADNVFVLHMEAV